MTDSRYAAKPWLGLLGEAQRAPMDPADSLVHALRRAADETPDRAFLAYSDGRPTCREVDEPSDSVAGHLAARGLERGDRVAVLLQNSPHFVLTLLGAWKGRRPSMCWAPRRPGVRVTLCHGTATVG